MIYAEKNYFTINSFFGSKMGYFAWPTGDDSDEEIKGEFKVNRCEGFDYIVFFVSLEMVLRRNLQLCYFQKFIVQLDKKLHQRQHFYLLGSHRAHHIKTFERVQTLSRSLIG